MTSRRPQLQDPRLPLLEGLTAAQQGAVQHDAGPLLVLAGAGTGKTTVIARRIAWLLATGRAQPQELLALTFTDKAAAEMEERVDLLVPYGYLEIAIKTFHAFGDQLLREHAVSLGLSPQFRVLSKAEQLVLLRRHIFDLPLTTLRPLNDPTRHVETLAGVISRAKDEAAGPEAFRAAAMAEADESARARWLEIADAYAAYQELLRQQDAVDFGDLVLLAIRLFEDHADVLAAVRGRFRYTLVDEFQDTNYAQYRLLELLAPPDAQVTVVGDDDQSIYKWRGAALSNVLKFLEHYDAPQTVVLTDNFRSGQALLDCAYRLVRHNDPERLEVRQGVDKRLRAWEGRTGDPPKLQVFDTVSSEVDWVARTIREGIEAGRRPSDFAILVRSNRDADPFLRALNVAGIPWQFSGASGLLAREESKLLISALKVLADPEDGLSWYHVLSSPLYGVPMDDLAKACALARRHTRSLQTVLAELATSTETEPDISSAGRALFAACLEDVRRLLELSRMRSPGQLLYQWLSDRGLLQALSRADRLEDTLRLQTIARFFDRLRRVEELVGGSLPAIIGELPLFAAIADETPDADDPWADQVSVLTIHKAKGLEFPVVFLVGLVQGRFPTSRRRAALELPLGIVKDLLPEGDGHLQEERRLFYVGMTRAQDTVYLTAAHHTGGKQLRKLSQFVVEALDLPSPRPGAVRTAAREVIERSAMLEALPVVARPVPPGRIRLDAHGIDDYLTCPLKYRYSHILRLPVMRHHLVVYGLALHQALEQFFRRQLAGHPMTEAQLLEGFEREWRAEGFLSPEHEARRRAQGRETLRRFYVRQQEAPEHPSLIEERFAVTIGEVVVVGRWDRVDEREGGAVIIDYKTSADVQDQRAADRRAAESLQMLLYALAWRELRGQLPTRVELRFLESELTGRAEFTDDDLARARDLIGTVAEGIRRQAFPAHPQESSCRWCAFQSICPLAFRAG